MMHNRKLLAQQLKDQPLKYIPNECFDDPAMKQEILAPMPDIEAFEEARKHIKVPTNVTPEIAQLYIMPILTKAQEQHMFRKMNYLKHHANKRIESLREPLSRTQHPLLTRIQQMLNEVGEIRNFLGDCNVRLAFEYAKKQKNDQRLSIGELLSDAFMTTLRAIDLFDYARNFKFSTYAVWSIKKNFCRSIPLELGLYTRFQTGYDEPLALKLDRDPEVDIECDDQQYRIKKFMADLLRHLPPRSRKVLVDYYAKELTLEQIGKSLKLTKERVRQIREGSKKRLQALAKKKNIDVRTVLGLN